jgi:FkbM family methyltransferase
MRLINGKELQVPVISPELREHFDNPYNYTKEIMQQFDVDYYKGIIEPCDTLLDIGANIGLFSLHVSPFAKNLICVEPTPSHFDKLKELMGFRENKTILINAALSNYSGITKFYWCGINTTMNSLQNRGDRVMDVPCITLADILNNNSLDTVDFCKIDIEGSEDTAITVETLKSVAERIKKVFIELHPPNAESQDKFKAIFEAVGYKVEKYVHDSLICTR